MEPNTSCPGDCSTCYWCQPACLFGVRRLECWLPPCDHPQVIVPGKRCIYHTPLPQIA
ncbi:MAG: hypothetical protein IKO33_02300 [Bacteroidaceae bacterium]|nr:hypothetical protein [Bacteroidaceae bacterium]